MQGCVFVGLAELDVAEAVPFAVFGRLAVRYVLDGVDEVDTPVTRVVPFVVIVWFRAVAVPLPSVDVDPDIMVKEGDGVSMIVEV